MPKSWSLIEKPEKLKIDSLQKSLSIPPIIAQLLVQRNLTNFEEAKAFFRPDISLLHDPFLMKDMHRAVNRIEEAILKRERIMIFGDYDVDGTTAVAVCWNVLSEFYDQLECYIPDRYIEGYGVSKLGIDTAHEHGVTLIISLDCGIRSVEKVDYASKLGIDFIICDHHQPGNELPNCIVLDPLQVDCNYPFKGLSGCGVGFKLLQAYLTFTKKDTTVLFQQLDLVAISIGADIVSLSGENRILCYHGLRLLNQDPRKGIVELLKIAGKKLPLLLTDVVFIIAPRINAAGRIHSGKKAVDLMISSEEALLIEIATSIDLDNQERKELDAQITKEALQLISDDPLFGEYKSTLVFQNKWHKGVVGIVASRLIETHYRPTIVLTESNGKATGSARSVKGFDIHHALCQCEDLLDQFGGHTFAAGMTLPLENVPLLKKRFDSVVSNLLRTDMEHEIIQVDAEISFADLFEHNEPFNTIPKLKRLIDQMEPYGPGNMKPIFVSRNIQVCEASLIKEEHIKLRIKQDDCICIFNAIGFRIADLYHLVNSGKRIDIAYTIDTNTWNDKTTIQLIIKDIQISLSVG